MNDAVDEKSADATKVLGFKFGAVRVPINEVVICPLTGRALVRDVATAKSRNVHGDVHAARLVPAGKAVGRLAAGCATYVDPDVDGAGPK